MHSAYVIKMQMGGKRAYLGVLLLEARRMAMEAGG
jgi:hypothetical protein